MRRLSCGLRWRSNYLISTSKSLFYFELKINVIFSTNWNASEWKCFLVTSKNRRSISSTCATNSFSWTLENMEWLFQISFFFCSHYHLILSPWIFLFECCFWKSILFARFMVTHCPNSDSHSVFDLRLLSGCPLAVTKHATKQDYKIIITCFGDETTNKIKLT